MLLIHNKILRCNCRYTTGPKRLKFDGQSDKLEIPNHSAPSAPIVPSASTMLSAPSIPPAHSIPSTLPTLPTNFVGHNLFTPAGHSQKPNNYLPNAVPNNLIYPNPHLPVASTMAPEINSYVCGPYGTFVLQYSFDIIIIILVYTVYSIGKIRLYYECIQVYCNLISLMKVLLI